MTNFERYKDFFKEWAGKKPFAVVNVYNMGEQSSQY